MENQNENAKKHIGETKAVPNHVHDLVHELSVRIDAVWRNDQCISNAENGGPEEEKQF